MAFEITHPKPWSLHYLKPKSFPDLSHQPQAIC